jgi:hypothetical protein
MNKKLILIGLCIMFLAAGAITHMSMGRAVANSQNQPKGRQPAQSLNQAIPIQVLYWQMFNHIALLNQKADEVEAKGGDGSAYRSRYKTFARLNGAEAQLLNAVALETYQKVKALDARAKQIVDAIRAQTPDGKLQPGQLPPAPPAELKEMQKERDEMVMAAYARLRDGFGPTEFPKFEKFVNESVAPNIKAVEAPDSLPRASGARQPKLLQGAGRAR